mmetsp:Transcript_4722/g.9499  ORF Transcript_4722/g.9499 Transcript_4722/m.9499 type:complete len:319 (-) Transcript_4722:426-1382(-)
MKSEQKKGIIEDNAPTSSGCSPLLPRPSRAKESTIATGPVAPTLFQSVLLGGISCIFTVNFTHPLETIKTRMQVSGNGLGREVALTWNHEGVTAFWKGIAFAYLREGSYAAIKIGGYAPIRDALGANQPDSPVSLKFAAGGISGAIGSAVGNPFDVLKTLSQTNKGVNLPLSTLVGNMYKAQGIRGFFRGLQVNVMRACVLSASQMGIYDVAKGYVAEATGWGRNDVKTVGVCSVLAGFLMTFTVAPFDRIRTELMNQPTDRKLYNGLVDCTVQTVRKGGALTLWRAFIPIWARFAPSVIIQLMTVEALYSALGFKSI